MFLQVQFLGINSLPKFYSLSLKFYLNLEFLLKDWVQNYLPNSHVAKH